MKCPECGSDKIKKVEYMDITCIVCDKCGYDEREIYDDNLEERTSQREKSRYNPYKSGR